MGEDCLFCKIIAGDIPADVVYQDDHVFCFRDIDPQAPTHVLVVPREHIPNLATLDAEHQGLVSRIMAACNQVARLEGVAESGYRVSVNCGPDGGQVVPHVHFHVLGGRRLSGALG